MAARKVLVGVAVLALGAAIVAPAATAFSPCGYRACSDEVAASGLSGQARGACVKQVIADCRAGLCSCTGGSSPCSCVCGDGLCGPFENCSACPGDCGPCSTTTTTMPSSMCVLTGLGRGCDPTSSLCCPVPNGSVFCGGIPTACRLGVCDPGYANCNMEAADGCEVNLNTDPYNCGSCGTVCATGTSCVMGSCF